MRNDSKVINLLHNWFQHNRPRPVNPSSGSWWNIYKQQNSVHVMEQW